MAVDLVEMDDLKHILKNTITAICRSRLHQSVQLSIEALIGVTINKSQMFLVNINEDLKSDASLPATGFHQSRPVVNIPHRKVTKAVRGRSSSVHSFSSLRASNRGRTKGLKNILPRLPISATQSSTPPDNSVQNIKEEKDSPPEKKARSILLTAGDTFSPDTGELLPNPSNIIPLEPRFDTPQGDQSRDQDESEENNINQISDMLPGIEGSHTDASPSRQADEYVNDSLMSSTSQQSDKASQEDEDTIGTLSMVCDADDPMEDSFQIKQEAPDYDDSYDQDGQESSSPVAGPSAFPSPKILDILNQPPKTFPKECRKRKILTLERRIQVLEMLQTGRSARSIAAQLGVGRTQIQNILKEKELILSKWVQGANSDMKYINPRRRPYADVDNLVWQWFQEYSSCGVHITGKLIQRTALDLAKALGNEKFSASNGWLESWQRRHNVKLSALYEAHKSKPNTSQEAFNITTGSEDQDGAKINTSSEEPSESETFFKSGQEVIMETAAGEERSDSPEKVGETKQQTSAQCSPGNDASIAGSKIGLARGIAFHATKAALKSFENANPRMLQQSPHGNPSTFQFNVFNTDLNNYGTFENANDRAGLTEDSAGYPLHSGGPSDSDVESHLKTEEDNILDILNQPPLAPVYIPRRRKALTLEDRVAVIQMNEAGQSARGIAAMYDVGKTQIQNILKDRYTILNKWMEGVVSKDAVYLNPRQLTYADIDHLVWQWYQRNSSPELRISGKQIQDTALQIAKELGYDKFTASTGWLNGWQKRHNIRLGPPQGSKPNTSDYSMNSLNQRELDETIRLAVSGAILTKVQENSQEMYKTLPEDKQE